MNKFELDKTMECFGFDKKDCYEICGCKYYHDGRYFTIVNGKSPKELAKLMTEHGADLIIGTHPHVLQPIEWIETDNGNKALCYYSLGNYTSGQKATPRVLGGMAKLTISKKDGSICIEKAEIVPTITHYEWVNGTSLHQTYKLSDYTDNLEKRHSLNYYDSTFSFKAIQKLANDIVGEWIKE